MHRSRAIKEFELCKNCPNIVQLNGAKIRSNLCCILLRQKSFMVLIGPWSDKIWLGGTKGVPGLEMTIIFFSISSPGRLVALVVTICSIVVTFEPENDSIFINYQRDVM